MSKGLIVVYFTDESLNDYRIGEISLYMRENKSAVFIVAADSEKAFKRYVQLLGRDLTIYNREEYIPAKNILKSIWGFSKIWTCSAERLDEYKILRDSPMSNYLESFPVYPKAPVLYAI